MRENGAYFCEGLLGLKSKHPEFHRVASAINALLIRKSFLDEKLRSAKRSQLSARNIGATDDQAAGLCPEVAALQKKSAGPTTPLDELFQ